jgi:hypothetical protein
MAEEKTGQKWTGEGKPPGQGGKAKEKGQGESEAGGRYGMWIRGACGHLLLVDSSWSWAECPIDGIITHAW